MSAVFEFVSALAIIGLSAIGFVVSISIFLAWFDSGRHADSHRIRTAVETADQQIDRLQAEAIDDMFDLARRVQFERHTDTEDASVASHQQPGRVK